MTGLAGRVAELERLGDALAEAGEGMAKFLEVYKSHKSWQAALSAWREARQAVAGDAEPVGRFQPGDVVETVPPCQFWQGQRLTIGGEMPSTGPGKAHTDYWYFREGAGGLPGAWLRKVGTEETR